MPQMFDLCNDETYDALSKRTTSSMRYEHLVLAPALSYMHDAIVYSESTMDWLEDEAAASAGVVKVAEGQGLGVAPRPRPTFPRRKALGALRPSSRTHLAREVALQDEDAEEAAKARQAEGLVLQQRPPLNGYHAVGIDPAFHEYMQFDVRGELFQCGTLPSGGTTPPTSSLSFQSSWRMRARTAPAEGKGVERRGVVAQTAGSKPVERVQDLEEPYQVKTVHSFLRELTGKVMWFQQLEALADEWHSAQGTVQTWQPELVPGSKVKVYWPFDDAWYQGAVGKTSADGLTRIAYGDGDEENIDMSREKYEVVPAAVQQVSGCDAALQARWRTELGDSSLTELAVQMQSAALGRKTVGNHRPKAQAFVQFRVAEGRPWLPATEVTVRLCSAHLLSKGTIKAAGVQPYLSTINKQVQAADEAGEEQTVRTWLPARHVSAVHAHGLELQPVGRAETELLMACTYVVFAFVTFGRPDTGVSRLRTHVSITGDTVSGVLHKEKGGRHVRLKRMLTIPAAGVQGLVQLLQHWQQLSSAIHPYIDPTAVPDEHMEQYFGWKSSRWREQQSGTGQCA
ncbi:hypothetical protein CYMTET_14740 [Cymbomonas tetramitiformis]|uniref:Uncharacterized protein n=1 Tax=Cymbomonas tetramitiformis TaxID=36881 RepID=A0AAE0GFW7_9CHLO|nr:hypothetical protein CYMTET_14740 [Cymbomonas tetramitiformis]